MGWRRSLTSLPSGRGVVRCTHATKTDGAVRRRGSSLDNDPCCGQPARLVKPIARRASVNNLAAYTVIHHCLRHALHHEPSQSYFRFTIIKVALYTPGNNAAHSTAHVCPCTVHFSAASPGCCPAGGAHSRGHLRRATPARARGSTTRLRRRRLYQHPNHLSSPCQRPT